MPIKCDDNCASLAVLRVSYRLSNDLLMPEMHAIEHPNRQAGAAASC
jgi:hypothetical protein